MLFSLWQCIQYAVDVSKLEVVVTHLIVLIILVGHDKDAAVRGDGVLRCHNLGIQVAFAIGQLGGDVWEVSCPMKFSVHTVAHGFVQSLGLLFADGHILLKIIFVYHSLFCIVAGWLALPFPFF